MPFQGRRDAHDRILTGNLVLLLGAEPHEADDDRHRYHDQKCDWHNDRVDNLAARHRLEQSITPFHGGGTLCSQVS